MAAELSPMTDEPTEVTGEHQAKRSTFDDPVLIAKTAALFRRARERRLAAEALTRTGGSEASPRSDGPA